MSTKTIDLIYFNAGGGHRASALALEAALRRQAPAWQVRLVNLFEVLDPQDKFRALTGSGPEDWYNKRLARGWTLGMTQELKLLQAAIRLGHPLLVRQLQQHWLRTEPDLVVSLVPNFNRALYQSLASVLPGVPYVTQLILICGHNKALAARLRQLPQVAPRLVVEFTADIPYYMRLADFFIGKPGPGSISEAVQQGLPVIVVDNAWTMPQERYNAEWVRENGLGVVPRQLSHHRPRGGTAGGRPRQLPRRRATDRQPGPVRGARDPRADPAAGLRGGARRAARHRMSCVSPLRALHRPATVGTDTEADDESFTKPADHPKECACRSAAEMEASLRSSNTATPPSASASSPASRCPRSDVASAARAAG